MRLSRDHKALTKEAIEIAGQCRVSQAKRSSVYRTYGQWIETGRPAGDLALANMLYSHIDRLHSHLFSPTDLRFSIDFENPHEDVRYKQGDAAAKILTREWERRNIDTVFGSGVKEALKYGACIMKQLVGVRGGKMQLSARLTSPWNFGVYNEGVTGLEDQEAVCETVYLSKPEVWRRIRHLPEPEKLFRRITEASTSDSAVGAPQTFFHQVLSTAVLDTNLQNATNPQPGGVVNVTNNPNFANIGPEVGVDLFPMHEIYVQDDERDDWVTIQLVEPDILVAPLMKFTNLFCPDTLPYTLIQPNEVAGYFWGRSEVTDLLMLQDLLTKNFEDMKRLMALQYDKVIGFPGYEGLSDEVYDGMRGAGYYASPPGSQIVDLTPQFPQHGLAFIKFVLEMMDMVTGFTGPLAGRGEPGVRAGNHADTLVKTGSPRLRDRSLLVERQCATAADQSLSAMQAKDDSTYWIDTKKKEGDFLLSQLPEDRRVTVDSHSTSPIYQDDHANLVAFGLKSEILDKEDAAQMLPFNNRDRLVEKIKEREKAKAEFIQQHPELLQQHTSGKKKAG